MAAEISASGLKTPPWSEWLPQIVYAMNTQVHDATGASPYELVFGQRARTVIFSTQQSAIVLEEDLADEGIHLGISSEVEQAIIMSTSEQISPTEEDSIKGAEDTQSSKSSTQQISLTENVVNGAEETLHADICVTESQTIQSELLEKNDESDGTEEGISRSNGNLSERCTTGCLNCKFIVYETILAAAPTATSLHHVPTVQEPIRVNVTRNARPSLSLEVEIPDYEFVEPVISEVEQLVTVPSDAGSISPRAGTVGNYQQAPTTWAMTQANIVRMLKLLGMSEKSVFSDVKRFPSVDDRRKAKFRNDLNATAFHSIQRVFRAMTAGILKMLLPAWHVPELKKWIKIPDAADREDSDDSDGDGENALPALNASELAVTRSIALSIANCRGTTTSVKAWMLMAQMSDLTSNYVEKMLSDSGRKLSQATLRCAMFQAKVDAEYLHRGLQLTPFLVTHQRIAKEVIQLAVDTVYSSKHVSRLAWLSKKRPFLSNKWKDLEHVDSMKSLVLKNDVQEMFKEYV
eukprot:Em0021g415a